MILFTILALTLLMLIGVTIFAISAGGAFMIVIFGDVIVCAVFIALILKLLIKRRRS